MAKFSKSNKTTEAAVETGEAVEVDTKKKTAKPVGKKTAAKEAPSKNGGSAPRNSGKTYTLKKSPKADEDLPKQAIVILEVLKAKGGELTRADFVKALEGKIETTQPVERILSFYQAKLVTKGFIKIA